MTLKTNSKQARSNVRAYIMQHADFSGYDIDPGGHFPDVARAIMSIFREEKKRCHIGPLEHPYLHEELRFIDWCQGLPSVLDTCYYYNRSAVADLGAILQQSIEKREQYEESQAEELLTKLIYKELKKGCSEI